MSTRTITGVIYHPGGVTAWSNANVVFRLAYYFSIAGYTFPEETYTAVTNAAGAFTVNIAVPTTGTAQYQVTLPDGTNFYVNLAAGAATTLEALIAIIANPTAPQNTLQTLIDAHAGIQSTTAISAHMPFSTVAEAQAGILTTKAVTPAGLAADFLQDKIIHGLTIGLGGSGVAGNSAIGVNALCSNITGDHNSAVGMQALYYNTTGSFNSAIGMDALMNNTTGSSNSAVGVNAGRFIGDGATANETSNTSTYLGTDTKALANGDVNEIIIGYGAIGLGSNTAVLGNSSIIKTVLCGQVGIGTTSPLTKLSVYSGVGGAPRNSGSDPSTATFRLRGSNNSVLDFGLSAGASGTTNWIQSTDKTDLSLTYSFVLNPNGGQVGIGTTTPAYALSFGATFEKKFALFENVGGGNMYGIGATAANYRMQFFAGGTEFMSLMYDGRVGIGTTNPNVLTTISKAAAGAVADILFLQNQTALEGYYATSALYFGCNSSETGIGGVARILGSSKRADHYGSTLQLQTHTTSYGESWNIGLFMGEAGNVGIGTTTPNANAILDVSSTTKAFMPPRMTTVEKAAIAGPTEGMVVYDTTLHKLCVQGAAAWETVTSV